MNGQTAIVTGGGRGIGRTIAEFLAQRGVNVVIVGVNIDIAHNASSELEKLGIKSIAVKADVSNAPDVNNIFERALREFGRVEILINNAGITKDGLLLRMREEDWDTVININLKGTFLCSREAVKVMSKQRYGRIINIASVIAFTGNPGQVNYGASKAGIVGLTKTIAKEYASRNITVNAVAPGFIMTAMTETIPENIKQDMINAIPLGRFGVPEDVANAVIFLASTEASYITGQVIHINGGMYM
ncbi:3-oxoacyl-[acyl-carrier-protein] reductase [Thermodesulfovibrionales bacterium]|nr:3-oxoacyl-[acyl-carrier-protein] reductase [Thermodesulfovibrionales bacterium]MCL0033419.1 3-oxoacyl-[acyl-carrier-protein] reductase [Thermodesulfovibrionales bacterium]MCL0034171.1 3-oxoacyl-[acyl-carrier-protein] reductase [Thermodesulfovibrionales bacterium]MCL0035768.1 3-oxoacyl-[acyl-carrier-protein] reductase [Thermodesulfovibrionales bacterium]MCL0038051.1 3-oxoacyl-[acyl-carrier-protein] reductase [Thermodesulfovibrionales bacterium]